MIDNAALVTENVALVTGSVEHPDSKQCGAMTITVSRAALDDDFNATVSAASQIAVDAFAKMKENRL